MKKLLGVAAVLILLLCGCVSNLTQYAVNTLNCWSFQHTQNSGEYNLFFAFCDQYGNELPADASVSIRIEDKYGSVLYDQVHAVTADDFGYYTNEQQGDHYLANVRIRDDQVLPGKSSSGTVYFTVWNSNSFSFDECNCPAISCLPLQEMSFTAESLPQEIILKSIYGGVGGKIRLDNITWEINPMMDSMTRLQISGEKIYSAQVMCFDQFVYKIYDKEGYVIDSGPVYLDDLDTGDKFREEIDLYDMIPGEAYTVQFSVYDLMS